MNLALHGFLLQVFLSIFDFQHGFWLCSAGEPGYLDFDNLPETNFSCQGKVIGGYYADVEAGCQMFHVCTIGQKDEIMDIKFLCLNGTVFDQETRVCERVDEVDCSKSERFYNLNLELYGNNAVTLSLHEDIDEEDEFSDSVEDNQQRTTSVRPTTTTTASSTTPRPSKSSTPASSGSYQPTGYPQHYQPQPPFPQVHTSQSKSLYDNKNGGYHHQYIFHNGERNNNQATSYQLFSNQGVSSTTIQTPQVHQVRFSSTSPAQIIHNEASTVSPLYHSSSTIQTLLNSNANSPNLINPIFHNHGIASTTEQFVHSNNPRETSEYQEEEEQEQRSIRPLEAVQSTNQGKVSKLTISPVPMQQDSSRTVHAKIVDSQQQRLSSNFLPTPSTIETTIKSLYPTPRTSPKPSPASSSSTSSASSTSSSQVTHHIHVPPPVPIPHLKPQQITINLPPPDIQRIVQNPSPLLPSQSRVIVTAKASVSDESGRPLNTTQLVTLPLPTIPASYDDYKEGDESFDPFYRDVPKIRSNFRITKSTSRLKTSSRRKRSLMEVGIKNRKRQRRSLVDRLIRRIDDLEDPNVNDRRENQTRESVALGKGSSEEVEVDVGNFRAFREVLLDGSLAKSKNLMEGKERADKLDLDTKTSKHNLDLDEGYDSDETKGAVRSEHRGGKVSQAKGKISKVSENDGERRRVEIESDEASRGITGRRRLDRIKTDGHSEVNGKSRPHRRRKGPRRKSSRNKVAAKKTNVEIAESHQGHVGGNDSPAMTTVEVSKEENGSPIFDDHVNRRSSKEIDIRAISQPDAKYLNDLQRKAQGEASKDTSKINANTVESSSSSKIHHSHILDKDEKNRKENVDKEESTSTEDIEHSDSIDKDKSEESVTISDEEDSIEDSRGSEKFASIESMEGASSKQEGKESDKSDETSSEQVPSHKRKDRRPVIEEGLDSGFESEEVTKGKESSEEVETEEYPTTISREEYSSEQSSEYPDSKDSSGDITRELTTEEEFQETESTEDTTSSEEYSGPTETEISEEQEEKREEEDEEVVEEVTGSNEEYDSGLVSEELSTEGVLKFTDEIPKADKKEESEEMKDKHGSSKEYSEDYVDDNYEPESYKHHESSTHSGDSHKKKKKKEELDHKYKENKRKQGTSNEELPLKDEERLKNVDLSANQNANNTDYSDKEQTTTITNTSAIAKVAITTSTTTSTTTTTTTSTTVRPKLFKPFSIRKNYVFVPPSTTPVPVIIKPRLSLLHPKPAKPPKSYNELAPKPVIRKHPLLSRKTTVGTTTEKETTINELEYTTTEQSVSTTEMSTSEENILESKVESKNIQDSTGDSSIQKSQALLRNIPESNRGKDEADATFAPTERIEEETTRSSTDESTFYPYTLGSSSTDIPAEYTTMPEDAEVADTFGPSSDLANIDEAATSKPDSKISEATASPEEAKPQQDATELPEHLEEALKKTEEEVPSKSKEVESLVTEDSREYQEPATIPEEPKEAASATTTESPHPDDVPRATEVNLGISSSISTMNTLVTTTPSTLENPVGTTMGNIQSTTVRIADRKYSAQRKHTSFNCLEKEMYRFYGDSRDCRLFHYCSPGFTPRQVLDFRFVCEKGTAFDEETQSCRHDIGTRKCANNRLW